MTLAQSHEVSSRLSSSRVHYLTSRKFYGCYTASRHRDFAHTRLSAATPNVCFKVAEVGTEPTFHSTPGCPPKRAGGWELLTNWHTPQ